MKSTRIFVLLLILASFSQRLYGQEFKFETSIRAGVQFYHSQEIITFGYKPSANKVIGIALGNEGRNFDAYPCDTDALLIGAYYRYYAHFANNSRLSLCTDFFLGGSRYYYISSINPREGKAPRKKGDWEFYASFQPSLDIGLGKQRRSHLFLGLSIMPSIGLHIGYAISF